MALITCREPSLWSLLRTCSRAFRELNGWELALALQWAALAVGPQRLTGCQGQRLSSSSRDLRHPLACEASEGDGTQIDGQP